MTVLAERAPVPALRRGLQGLALAAALALSPSQIGTHVRHWRTAELEYGRRLEIAARIRAVTATDARLAVDDAAPAWTYHTGRPTISLDGFYSSPRYVREILPRSRQAD